MKIKSKKTSRRKLVVLIVAVVFALLAAVAVAYFSLRPGEPETDGSTTSSPRPNNEDTTPQTDTSDQQSTAEEQKGQPVDATTPNTSPTIPVIITAANQNNTSSTLQVRTMIEKITSTGSCVLTLTKDGQTISKSSNIQAGPNNSTCRGFDVALAELSSGVWSVKIDVTSGEQSGSASSEVTINAT